MSAKDVFAIVVRTVGLILCVRGLYLLVEGMWDLFRAFLFHANYGSATLMQLFVHVLAPSAGWVGSGWLLMRRADQVVRFAYPLRSGTCAKCGYDMRATPGRCPECGAIPES